MSDFSPDIWRLQAQGDIRGLIEAIKHTSPDVRRRAVAALRALGASSAIPALQAALVKEQDAEVRRAMIVTLDSLFQQEVDEDSDSSDDQYTQVVRLIAQLSSRQPERIIRAAHRLGELKEKIAAESLILVFHNRELPSRVRLAAAEALLELESAPIEVALLGALRHSDWRVRRNAIAVLGQLDADWAIEPLREALKDGNDLIQRTAQAALKRIGTPEALIALAAASIAEKAAAETPVSPPRHPQETKVKSPVETPAAPSKTEDKVKAAAETPAPAPAQKDETGKPAADAPPVPASTPVETIAPADPPPAPSQQPVDEKVELSTETPSVMAQPVQDAKAEATIEPPPAPALLSVDAKTEAAEAPLSEPVHPPPDTKIEVTAEQTSAVAPPSEETKPPVSETVASPDEEDTQPIQPVS